jgi:hypothetical protein
MQLTILHLLCIVLAWRLVDARDLVCPRPIAFDNSTRYAVRVVGTLSLVSSLYHVSHFHNSHVFLSIIGLKAPIQ